MGAAFAFLYLPATTCCIFFFKNRLGLANGLVFMATLMRMIFTDALKYLWYKKMLSTSMNPHIVFHRLLSGGRVETEAWAEEQTYREEDTGSTLGRFWNLSLFFFFFLLILAPSVDPREEPRLLRYERAPRPPRHQGSENQRASEKGSTKRFFKLFFDVTVSSIDLEILFSKRTLTCKRFELFP